MQAASRGWVRAWGVIVRDKHGSAKLGATWQGVEVFEPKVAEARAVLLGLQLAREYGYVDVMVESDCLTLVNAIQKNEEGWSQFHLIVDDIIHVSKVFSNISFSFVSRECNKTAHELAHYLPWVEGRRVWLYDFPASVDVCLIADCLE